MKKVVLLILIVLAFALAASCVQSEFSVQKEDSMQTAQNKESSVCSPPYIKISSGCCLDSNNNGVCDSDDAPESVSEIQKPEVPAQPNKEIEKSAGECALPGGLKCIGSKVTPASIQIILSNSLGYDVRSVVAEAQNCGDSDVISIKSGESGTLTIVCNYALTGLNYDGVLSVQYTNAKTGLSYYDSGRLNATIV